MSARPARRLAAGALMALVAISAAACEIDHGCRPGTLLVHASLDGVAAADRLRVVFTLTGSPSRQRELQPSGRGGEIIEVTFPSGYPVDQRATVALEALAGGVVIARVEDNIVLVEGCTAIGLALVAAHDDGGPAGPDLRDPDLQGADLAPPGQCLPRTACPAVACGTTSDGCGGTLSCAPCQLVAVTPSLSQIGATIALEGTFGELAVVHFPGGVTAPASVLGPHRATAVVPAGTTTGDLTVAVGGGSVGPLPFRAVPFTLALGRFYAGYDQAGGARQMPSLVYPRLYATTAVVGDALFVIGGGAAALPIERATINADGTLSSFSVVTSSALVHARQDPSSVVIGRTIYVFGGDDDGTVERATVDEHGTLSPFEELSVNLDEQAVHRASPVVIGNFVYIVGGANAMHPDGQGWPWVQRATIQPDGTLSKFSVLDVQLHDWRAGAWAFVRGQVLYVVGGDSRYRDQAQGDDTVETATIAGDGSLSAFTVLPYAHLDQTRTRFAAVNVGDATYLVSGQGRLSPVATTERAAFDAGGALSTFHVMPGLQPRSGRVGASIAIAGNYAYLIGGQNGGAPAPIERASLDDSGFLSSFSEVPGVEPARTRAGHIALVAGRSFYLIGGATAASSEASVERSAIAGDGSLSSFALLSGVALTTPRSFACGAVAGRWLYVIGGSGEHDAVLASVERAEIGEDGTLSTFAPVPTISLKKPRARHSCVIHGARLFVVGGDSDGGDGTIESADIGPDGSLSGFSLVAATIPSLSARNGTPALFGDTLYLTGTSDYHSTEYVHWATFDSGGGLTTFSPLAGTQTQYPRWKHASLVIGSRLYLLGGESGLSSAPTEATNIHSDDTIAGVFARSPISTLQETSFSASAIGNWVYVVGRDATAVTCAELR